jgi:hypothetical protein
LEELAEDPAILQIGQVLAPAPTQPAPAGPPPLRVYTRRRAAAPPLPTELEVPPPAPAVAAQTAPAVPAQPATAVTVQPVPATAVAASSIPPPLTSSRPVTRLQTGSLKPVDRYGFPPAAHVVTVSTTSPIPRDYRGGLADPQWREAMAEEHKALVETNTWRLVPRPPGANVVTGKWIFRHKFHSDGTLARHKARWVVRGFTQRQGVDYDETFSPVVKPATIRVVLSITASRQWPIHQLDVKNAFLHGHLNETVYCQQPPGFVDPARPDAVCLLQRSLYGLKQAPRAWHQRFATFLRQLGFVASATDASLFFFTEGNSTAHLLLYVDDIVFTASSATLLRRLIDRLHSEFAMTDLGELHHFLGISVTRSSDGLFLSQRQYAVNLLQKAGMAECHSTSTPVDSRAKLSAMEGAPVTDPAAYRSLAGSLQYLTLTRPDLAYAVQQVCLFMHDPREPHLALIKHILRYVKGTLSAGLHIGTGPVDKLMHTPMLTGLGAQTPVAPHQAFVSSSATI